MSSKSPVINGMGKLNTLYRQFEALGCRGRDWALLVFAGDHGVSQEGTSSYQALGSGRIVASHLDGNSPTSKLLERLGKKELIFDLGLFDDIDNPDLIRKRIRQGTRNFIDEDAMDYGEALSALEAGRTAWEYVKLYDYDMVGLGEIGIGNTLSASALGSVALRLPLELMIGPGSAGAGRIARKIELLRQAMDNEIPDPNNVLDILARFGGLEIAALTGFISEAEHYGIPIILDGFVTSVAALLAGMLNNKSLTNIFCPSLAMEPGHRLILERLQLEPWFDLDLNYGEGLAAVMGMFMAEMTMSFYQ
ncbi:MAG: nicotinate-nucleotide--dimethylbenzimidazole phosphoribosyltransferase [Syntrophomonadaceae bacterium]